MTNKTKETIVDIRRKAINEQWDYPRQFNALKEAGVESYNVDLSCGTTTIYTDTIKWQEPLFEDKACLPIAQHFDVDKLKQAIINAQNKETTYSQFLQDIARAGVKEYTVTMDTRRIAYKGLGGEHYYESVP